jgi:hypothetical protein
MSDNIAELKSELRGMESKVRAVEGALKDEKGRRVKLMVYSAIGGFLLFAVGGQWFPGYQLDSTAEATAYEKAAGAVSDVTAQLCVERFMKASGLESRLTALNGETGDWSKANYILNGTWATSPDGGKTDHTTADKCRALIAEHVAGESEKTS